MKRENLIPHNNALITKSQDLAEAVLKINYSP